jgi:hypothetical protein
VTSRRAARSAVASQLFWQIALLKMSRSRRAHTSAMRLDIISYRISKQPQLGRRTDN